MAFETPAGSRAVAVVGGGFSGTLLALKLAAARPDWRMTLVEPSGRPGRGLAYGACSPTHLLNVPVSRLETGLTPRFDDWLKVYGGMDEALAESGGDLHAAFAPRTAMG
ncbi:MAG TPA: FAD/NAD(P)-binding protein, partial [Caulobacter sp.]|nr:FAD/NAD(P)-binding protein [Caulobacter sp.]